MSKIYGIDEEPIEGKYYDIPRPDLRNRISRCGFELEIPSDLHVLFRLTESLLQEHRRNFKRACFAYQTALRIWEQDPSLSMLCLFMAIEVLIPTAPIPCDQICDKCKALLQKKGCERCRKLVNKNCINAKKIKQGVIDFISNMLSISRKEVRTMIPYDKRSRHVHEAIFFGYELSSRFPFSDTLSVKEVHPGPFIFIHSELERLRLLVRAALIEWLRKFQPKGYREDR